MVKNPGASIDTVDTDQIVMKVLSLILDLDSPV